MLELNVKQSGISKRVLNVFYRKTKSGKVVKVRFYFQKTVEAIFQGSIRSVKMSNILAVFQFLISKVVKW